MTFEEFCEFVAAQPIQALDDTFISPLDAQGERRARGRFSDEMVTERLPNDLTYQTAAYSERSYFGGLINILHPYSVLKLLAI